MKMSSFWKKNRLTQPELTINHPAGRALTSGRSIKSFIMLAHEILTELMHIDHHYKIICKPVRSECSSHSMLIDVIGTFWRETTRELCYIDGLELRSSSHRIFNHLGGLLQSQYFMILSYFEILSKYQLWNTDFVWCYKIVQFWVLFQYLSPVAGIHYFGAIFIDWLSGVKIVWTKKKTNLTD